MRFPFRFSIHVARRLTLATAALLVTAPLARATTIGVSMPGLDPFRTMLRDALQATADRTPGLTLRIVFAASDDAAQQKKDISGLIGSGVDGLIVFPIDADGVDEYTAEAGKADLPLVFVNNGPREEWFPGRVVMAIPNELVAGRLQMHMLAERMGGRGTIALLTGPASHTGATLRTAGVEEVLRTFPDIRIVERAAADWSRQKAKTVMAGWLRTGVRIDAVAANNDEMAIGAYEGWVAAGGKGAPPLIAGVDATPDGLAALAAHHLAVTVKQDAQMQGELALRDVKRLIDHQSVPQYDWATFSLVTSAP